MTPDFDSQTRLALDAARAAVFAAQNRADNYARNELDSAQSRVTALRDKLAGLGGPPASTTYATSAEWREAQDRHTFDREHLNRDLADAEDRLNDVAAEHARLLAEVAPLRQDHRRLAVAALDTMTARKLQEAADIATLRQSLLTATPMEEWPIVNPAIERRNPAYTVRGAGFPDVSFVNATVQTGGFTPDKSAALRAELGI